jgi:FtsJ-like methyltransferase
MRKRRIHDLEGGSASAARPRGDNPYCDGGVLRSTLDLPPAFSYSMSELVSRLSAGRALSPDDRRSAVECMQQCQEALREVHQKMPDRAEWNRLRGHCDAVPDVVADFRDRIRDRVRPLERADSKSASSVDVRHWIDMCSIGGLKVAELLTRHRFGRGTTSSVSPTRYVTGHLCEAPGGGVCATQFVLSESPSLAHPAPPSPAKPGAASAPTSAAAAAAPRGGLSASAGRMAAQRVPGSGVEHAWVASSLRGEGAMAARGDFMAATAEHWSYGPDGSGDLLKTSTIDDLAARCPGVADLITADGGLDTDDTPERQEALNFTLIYAQYVCALRMLRPGGMLILKKFTSFERSTRQLLIDMHSSFDVVTIEKPQASKAANGEEYVVCTGHRPRSDARLAAMMRLVNTPSGLMTSWAQVPPRTDGQEPMTHDDMDDFVIHLMSRYYENTCARQVNRIRAFMQHRSHLALRPCKPVENAVRQYWSDLFPDDCTTSARAARTTPVGK